MNINNHNHHVAESSADLKSVFSPDCIVTIPRYAEKSEVLSSLVKSLACAGQLPWQSVVGVIEALQERERFGTTGLGNGLALPSLRTRSIVDFAGAVGIAPAGVDFRSLDGLPTRLIILLLSPLDQREKHAEIMTRLATLLSDNTLQYSVQLPRSPEALFRFLGF